MKIMAVNAGSSSLKFQLFEMPEEKTITSGIVERIGKDDAIFTIKVADEKIKQVLPIKDHKVAVQLLFDALKEHNIISSLDEIEGVGHRVVQGGEEFVDSTILTNEVVDKIEKLSSLAPLHNPANVVGMRAFMKALPNIPQVAVFDTTFHQTMEPVNFLYATPYEWYSQYGLRKYGFHGTSHQYVSERAAKLLGDKKDAKIIVCHLGNGASITAVDSGKSVDTTMGLTPLEGIPMGTRSGNVDPALFNFMKEQTNMTLEEITYKLNYESGYLGVSGVSQDSRDIENLIAEGHERAKLALDIQVKRICDYIGSYYVLLGGLDAICFTAGIGENASLLRSMIGKRLKVLGITIDEALNELRGENVITTPDSKVKVFVIPTDEEVMIARDVIRLM